MSATAERVPAASLREGDFITVTCDGEDVFATVTRVIAPRGTGVVLVSWRGLTGGAGTTDYANTDEVARVAADGGKAI